jgi:protocatechuate 3,4-dioxygenase alpha subunit
VSLAPTPGQTVGPFYGYALPFPDDSRLVPPGSPGAVRLHGTVRDGAGAPVPDALLEIRQAGPDGVVPRVAGSLHRDGHTFTGWGRAATDNAGHYTFTTLTPGGTTPFFAVTVFARGLLHRLQTRAYLPGAEVVLPGLPDHRLATLVTVAEEGGYRFDVTLQGDGETVFLDHG